MALDVQVDPCVHPLSSEPVAGAVHVPVNPFSVSQAHVAVVPSDTAPLPHDKHALPDTYVFAVHVTVTSQTPSRHFPSIPSVVIQEVASIERKVSFGQKPGVAGVNS